MGGQQMAAPGEEKSDDTKPKYIVPLRSKINKNEQTS